MPLFKKKSAKKEAAKDQKQDAGKRSLAIAFNAQRMGKKKASGQDHNSAPSTPVSPKDDAENHQFAAEALSHEHGQECYAEGGMVCKYGTVADMIRRTRMAMGGRVEDDTESAFGEVFDDMNESMADGQLYDGDDISKQPEDSNEMGDEREKNRADAHGKSMFKKIKMKKAQPGDRGKY